eukprot:scaffold3084_cov144-Cylindrotheca_fusiformis.AAC.14
MTDSNDDAPFTPSSKPKIEEVFELIQEGKTLRELDPWNAADKFVHARMLLDLLATEQPRTNDEEKQIAALYEKQAWEYLRQSRECLIDAMKEEKDRDEEEEKLSLSELTDEQAEARLNTFASLFSRKMEIRTEDDSGRNRPSIEERLRDLNASLPSGFKTSEERMRDINQGLNKLGLSLYTQKAPFARFLEDEIPKDEDEQVNDIIAQAHDEVQFEKNATLTTETPSKPSSSLDDDEDEQDEESESDQEGKEDGLLEDDVLAMKKIRRRAEKAQVKLAELVVLLDEARAMREKEENDDAENDDNSSDSIAKPDANAHLVSAKKKLKGAQSDLKKAMTNWLEDLA